MPMLKRPLTVLVSRIISLVNNTKQCADWIQSMLGWNWVITSLHALVEWMAIGNQACPLERQPGGTPARWNNLLS